MFESQFGPGLAVVSEVGDPTQDAQTFGLIARRKRHCTSEKFGDESERRKINYHF
jgi:hypothetical protein